MQEGILPRQDLQQLIAERRLHVPHIAQGQLQPGSIDLRLGNAAWHVRSSFLPSPGETIPALAEQYADAQFSLSDQPTQLMRGATYIIELQESINLKAGMRASMNPKSSTGRADLLTYILIEGESKYDNTEKQQLRKLYIECTPLSWHTMVKRGTPLSQLRIGLGNPRLSERDIRIKHRDCPLLFDYNQKPIPLDELQFGENGLEMTVDLQSDIVAYRAKENSQLHYDITAGRGELRDRISEFREPIWRPKNGTLILEPNNFYLLATNERVRFPPGFCGTLEAYDVTSMEGRSHAAGYFDEGFGHPIAPNNILGTPATLEVRIYHKPLRIVNGQRICNMKFELMRTPAVNEHGEPAHYGSAEYQSNYQYQPPGPNLPKQFLR